MSLQVGSLFSGAGLCDLGLAWAGMEHRFFCEIDPFCRSVLSRHWPEIPIHPNIAELHSADLPPVDVLCGGFPCQDVSSSGKRAGIKQGTRSGLWSEYARLIDEIRPKYAVVENVLGLLSCGVEIVLQDLAAIGYDAEWTVLPAAALGAPHHRERVFVVAYPHRNRTDGRAPLLSALERHMEHHKQPHGVADWLGIRFDRTHRAACRNAFRAPALCRVDDGRAPRLDVPNSVIRATVDEAKAWIPRLKALGNGICPQQSYAIAACILEAEGLPVPPLSEA